jgi:repressor LexA
MDLVKDLTKRQREIFDYIGTYLSKHGYPPTVREIGKAVGLHSSSTVHAHLSKLESLGVLKRDPSKPRALEVLVERAKKAVRPSGLPLVGQVAAGSPVLAEENIEDYLEVPDVVGGEDGDYILRVRGESMKDAGILEGLRRGPPHGARPRRRNRGRAGRRRRGDRQALLP